MLELLSGLFAMLEPYAYCAALVFLRVLPTVMFVPVFGGPRVPPMIRMAIAGLLTFALIPGPLDAPATFAEAIGPLASQLTFGLLSAIAGLLVIEAVRMTGLLSDLALGRGSFGGSDALSSQSSPLASLYSLALVATIFATGTHRVILRLMHTTIEMVPLDQTISATGLEAGAMLVITLSASAIAAASAMVLPTYAVSLLIDFSMGWINRFMPSFPALFLAMPLRGLAGWAVVSGTLAGILAWGNTALPEWMAQMSQAMMQ